MKKNALIYTNLFVCIVIILGFIITASIGYHSNQSIFYKDTESVSTLTSEGIYHQIDSIFTKPINISLTMANDSLLKDFLDQEQQHPNDSDFIDTMRAYLNTYRQKYDYDSVFLASAQTKRYYYFNGLDRVLDPGVAENQWFYDFLEQGQEYTINIDNDEVDGARNEVTVFINCRIKGADGQTMGVVGVGFRVNSLQALLKSYEDKFGVTACLVNEYGTVEISTERTGFEGEVNLFDICPFPGLKQSILENQQDMRTSWYSTGKSRGYVVSQFVPNMNWHLIVENDTTALDRQLAWQFCREILIVALIIIVVLVTITSVMRRYNKKIIELTVASQKAHQTIFQKAAEQLYENIYEVDITHNRAASEETSQYFESLGAPPNVPYGEALQIIARKQIKEEYRRGYLNTFSRSNVLKAYENGIENLRYEFMISTDQKNYYWMRITAHIFFWGEDRSVRMLVYRENIDAEKRREIYLFDQMQKDSLTGLYNKVSSQEHVRKLLAQNPDGSFAFFILDIDDFKNVNDHLGHAAGDAVLIEFAKILKENFRENDMVGRIGGDEFMAFMPAKSPEAAHKKALELVGALHRQVTTDAGNWIISTSIGVALSPEAGSDFETLYKKADFALYQTKRQGKNAFTIYEQI